jgi:hypothetical protein
VTLHGKTREIFFVMRIRDGKGEGHHLLPRWPWLTGSGGEETNKQLAGDRNRKAKKLEDVVGSPCAGGGFMAAGCCINR